MRSPLSLSIASSNTVWLCARLPRSIPISGSTVSVVRGGHGLFCKCLYLSSVARQSAGSSGTVMPRSDPRLLSVLHVHCMPLIVVGRRLCDHRGQSFAQLLHLACIRPLESRVPNVQAFQQPTSICTLREVIGPVSYQTVSTPSREEADLAQQPPHWITEEAATQ